MKKITLWVGLVLLLMGCTTLKTQRPTSGSPEFIPTSQPTLAALPLPASTTTIVPPENTLQPAEPVHTAVPYPTPNLAATVIAVQQSRLYTSYPSPDGEWRVDIIIYDCIKTSEIAEGGWNENAYEQLIVVNLATGEEQVADEQLQYCGGLGAYGFDGRYWSTNSRYFYYTDARQGVPDGCGYWEPPLYRLDVRALAIHQFFGMGTRSPDGKQLATWNWPNTTLSVWNIEDEEILQAAALEPNAEIGPITWSPDSRSFVYIQVDSWCPLSGKSYLVLMDIANSQQTLLLESESPTFGSVRWETSHELSLSDENGNAWNFDLITHTLTRADE